MNNNSALNRENNTNKLSNYESIEKIIAHNSDFLKGFIAKRTWDDQSIEDIYQSTLLEALKSFHKFRGDAHPRTWLCGIAYNMIRNHARKSNIPAFEPLEVLDTKAYDLPNNLFGTENPEDIYSREDFMNQIKDVFDTMPETLRVTFNNVVSLGKSYEEAAEMLGVPVGTIRSRIARAREIFKKHCDY